MDAKDMNKSLEVKIGKELYDRLNNIVTLARKKKITKGQFDHTYAALYNKTMIKTDYDEDIESALSFVYVKVMGHYK